MRRDRRGATTAVKALVVSLLAVALAFAALPPAALGGLDDARQVPGPLNGVCQTCHMDPNGGAALNAFGADYADAYNQSGGAVNWSELGAKDSDSDGYKNSDEWSASYLPGDNKSNPGTGVKYGGFGGGDVANVATGAVALFALSLFGIYVGFRMLRKRNARVAKKEAAAAAQEPPDSGPP
jgi:hypothetical protein